MAGPYLVMRGISDGIPPLRDGNLAPLLLIGVAFASRPPPSTTASADSSRLSGRIGQGLLLDLRQRVYRHFQRLSIGFHERYTSGRMVARLTSDMDSISELVDGGIDDLVLAALSVVSIAGILLVLDPPLALAALASFPFLLWLSNWFRHASARAYRRTREAVALVIVHFVESLGGIRAVHAFRREPRNQEIFEVVNDDYRKANLTAFRLISIFAPGIKLIGNVTVAVVLTYGAYRALQRRIEPAVLVAFLLYLRRFFDPMQEISQFYNALQSATAALEKLSGVLQEEPGVPEPATPAPWSARPCRGAVSFDRVTFGYRRDRVVLPELDPRHPGRPDGRPGRRDRRRQVHGGQAGVPLLRPDRRHRPARRRRPARPRRRRPAPGRRDGDPGELPLLRLDRREHRVRPAGCGRGRGTGGRSRPSGPTRSSATCPTATTPTCASAAAGSPPVSASWSRSPGRSWPTRPC